MPDTDSITLVKSMLYRGVEEEWSNTYHLDGTTPTTAAEWKTLADAIWASEKTCVTANVKIAKYYGYEAGNDQSVYQLDFIAAGLTQTPGTLSAVAVWQMAGDQAATLRAYVGLSSTGKKVYVRKYFHGVTIATGAPDSISAAGKTAMEAHGALMLAGGLPGGMKWVAPQGAVPVTPQANAFVTTRTLKRRGKRPS